MKIDNKKRALAVAAGPYRFYQVLWLYTQYPEYQWSILLLPYGKGKEYVEKLHGICRRLGIFENIYDSDMTGNDSRTSEKFVMTMKMAFFAFTGRKKRLMKRIMLAQTKGQDFDAAFIGCEYSIIEGALIGLADEKEVYIFEEGLGDYRERKKRPSFYRNDWISFLVSRMGYFNPYGYFTLKNTKLCKKYVSLPDVIKYRDYKEILPLFEGSEETGREFRELVNSAYEVKEISLDAYDVIMLTTPMSDYTKEDSKYIELLHQWMVKQYAGRKILVKKHPRDMESYGWKEFEITFLDTGMPAEVFVDYIRNQQVVLMSASTTLLSLLQRKKNISVVLFDDIGGIYKDLIPLLKSLEMKEENIVHL